MRTIRKMLVAWSLMFFSSMTFAAVLELVPVLPRSGQALGSFLEFMKSQAKSPELLPEGPWISIASDHPGFGYTQDLYWARLRIHNPGPAQRLIFQFRGLITRVEMVDPQGQSFMSGISFGLEEDMPMSRFPGFVVEVPPGDSVFFFRNLTASKQFPLHAYPLKGFAARNNVDVFLLTLCCGVILGLALYYLLTCLVIRRLDAVLYTAYAFFALMFTLFLSGIARIFLPELASVLTRYYLAFASCSTFFSMAFTAIYLNLSKYHPRMMKIYQFGMLIEVFIFLLSFHPESYMWGMRLQQSVVFFWGLSFYLGLKARIRGYKPALWFALAWFVMVAGAAVAFASGWGIIKSTSAQNGIFIGTTFELIFMSLSLSEKIKDKERSLAQKLRDLNRGLEQVIQERTKDITSYLSHIKQGILQIQRNQEGALEIKEHHSQHLLHMFDIRHEKVAFAHPRTAVFSKLSLSDDEMDKCLDILETALGESLLQWEINQDNLPRETRIGQTQRLVEMEWNPVLNEKDLVESVLVSFKDVTEIRGLKEQALRESRKGMLIAIVANMKSEMARRFFRMIDSMTQENRNLIAAHAGNEPWNERDRQVFYRNVHTIKGSARGLGLDELVSVLHRMESLISANRFADVVTVHEEAMQIIRDLHAINDELLGRRSLQLNVIELTADEIERRAQAFAGEGALPGEFRKQIRLLAYSNMEKALHAEMETLPTLAARLGKETPRIQIENDDYALSEQLVDGLRRVFIHLLRNSLDHGLETAEERRACGKDPQGLMTITIEEGAPGRMRIRYRDDGRGLDLQGIRAKARTLGLDWELSNAEVASLIFLPSFSTKSEADDISGRGIGMDAIKAYMEELGGTVSLQLEAEKARAGYFAFSIIMELPHAHFVPLASEKFQLTSTPLRAAS